MISFVEETHVSMWACDEDFRIVLWNDGAARIYGRSADSVLGKRYDELIVHPAEREQSLEDCLKIIRDGTRFENFLASDHDARGRERQILTNCFRITDPISGTHYQAEIGVDIADLPDAQLKLRTLRELGIRQMVEREQSVTIRKTSLDQMISQIALAVGLRTKEKADALDENLHSVARRLGDENRVRFESRKKAVVAERQAIESELDDLRRRVAGCTEMEETIALADELGTVETWLDRIEQAAKTMR
jgi:PAS domain S-box-containing protein